MRPEFDPHRERSEQAEEQYRIYGWNHGLKLIATCGTPEALGVALVTLHAEDEFLDEHVGVLHRPDVDQPGTWIVNPWGRVEKARRFSNHPNEGSQDAAATPMVDT